MSEVIEVIGNIFIFLTQGEAYLYMLMDGGYLICLLPIFLELVLLLSKRAGRRAVVVRCLAVLQFLVVVLIMVYTIWIDEGETVPFEVWWRAMYLIPVYGAWALIAMVIRRKKSVE